MVMANKWVLNSTDTPLFFLLIQLLIAVLLFIMAHMVGLIEIPLKLDIEICRRLLLVVGLNVIGLSFNNYTLKYVDASFYQVARGLVLPFTVCTSYVVLHTRPSLRILFSCSIVTLGFFIGVFLDAIPISLLGISFGVTSSCITAISSVVIKKSLGVVNDSAIHLSWYANYLSAIVLVPGFVVMGELPAVMRLLFQPEPNPGPGLGKLATFLCGSLITGVIGFLISIAGLLSIKVTSPITHMVSSAVRGVASALLGVWLFHDSLSSGRTSSIVIILAGSIYYTWIKHVESQQTVPASYEQVPLEEVEEGQVMFDVDDSGTPSPK